MHKTVCGGMLQRLTASSSLWREIEPEDYYRRGIEINERLQEPEKSLVPALKGRNHAATPAQDQPR